MAAIPPRTPCARAARTARTPPSGSESPESARAVPGRDLIDRIDHLSADLSPSDHDDHAGPVAGADEHVIGPRRTMDEVPRLQAALVAFDDRDALSRDDEEVLLVRLAVVQAVRLPGTQHLDVAAKLRKPWLPFEDRSVAERVASPPHRIAGVEHEPALAVGHQPGLGLLENGLLNHEGIVSKRERARKSASWAAWKHLVVGSGTKHLRRCHAHIRDDNPATAEAPAPKGRPFPRRRGCTHSSAAAWLRLGSGVCTTKQHGRTEHCRQRHRRPDAHCESGHVVRHDADVVCLPLAPVSDGWRHRRRLQLRPDRRSGRQRLDVSASGRRRGDPDPTSACLATNVCRWRRRPPSRFRRPRCSSATGTRTRSAACRTTVPGAPLRSADDRRARRRGCGRGSEASPTPGRPSVGSWTAVSEPSAFEAVTGLGSGSPRRRPEADTSSRCRPLRRSGRSWSRRRCLHPSDTGASGRQTTSASCRTTCPDSQ